MTTSSLATWAEHELRHVALPDQRLNKRLIRLVADLARRPASSIPEAAGSWTLVAYNLASQVRRVAAARLPLPPRRLSFAGVGGLVKAFLAGAAEPKAGEQLQEEFERLLRAAGQRTLPRRPPGRSYPREVIPRRRKYTERKRRQPATLS